MKKTITVHLLNVKQVKENLSTILPLLPSDRIQKANRYRVEHDSLLSLGGSYLIEKYTGFTPILISKEGKPFKEGRQFSISHSGDYVAYAENNRPIGIDIQKIGPLKKSLPSFVMSEEEIKNFKKEEDFFTFWSLKESLMKCIGCGLKGDYKKIVAKEGTYLFQGHEFTSISSNSLDGYSFAITIFGKESFNVNLALEEIA